MSENKSIKWCRYVDHFSQYEILEAPRRKPSTVRCLGDVPCDNGAILGLACRFHDDGRACMRLRLQRLRCRRAGHAARAGKRRQVLFRVLEPGPEAKLYRQFKSARGPE